MSQSHLRFILGGVAAVAIPGAMLHFTTSDDRLAAGMSAAPFGWPRVLAAHLVASLPLGVLVAASLRRVPELAGVARWVWIVIGVAIAVVATVVFPGVGEGLAEADVGPIAALLLRAALGFGLVLPWCMAALGSPPELDPPTRPGLTFGLATTAALIPCGLFAVLVIEAQTKHAAELLGRDRLARAELVLMGLSELGSNLPVAERSPSQLRSELGRVLPRMRQTAAQPLPAHPTLGERIARSELLVRLDRLAEAAEVLEPILESKRDTVLDLLREVGGNPPQRTAVILAGTVPTVVGRPPLSAPTGIATAMVFRCIDQYHARLYLASIYRDQMRWAESDAILEPVLGDWLPEVGCNRTAEAICQPALDILVYNAKADHRPADTLRWLEVGLARLPDRAAYYQYQLGMQYQSMGRPNIAMRHLESAVALDPERYGAQVKEQLQQLRTHTPGCLLHSKP